MAKMIRSALPAVAACYGRVAAAARKHRSGTREREAGASKQQRLRRRAELIHWLLGPRTIK